MDESGSFGEIRSLMNGEPGVEPWERLCRLLEEEDDDRVREELVPYLTHYLSGWPEEVRVAPPEWGRVVERGERCARLLVARSLAARGTSEKYDVGALVSSPDLSGLRALDLGYNTFDEEVLEALEHTQHLRALRKIDVSDSKMGHEAFIRIIRAPGLSGLTCFVAAWCALENDGAEALAGVDELNRFERIELRGNRITPPAAQVLLAGKNFGGCRELAVGWNDIADDGVEAIVDSPYLGQLVELCLENNSIRGDSVLELLKRPQIRNLEKLRLYNNVDSDVWDDVAIAIAQSPYLTNLRELDLSSNTIGAAGIDALENSTTLHEDARAAGL